MDPRRPLCSHCGIRLAWSECPLCGGQICGRCDAGQGVCPDCSRTRPWSIWRLRWRARLALVRWCWVFLLTALAPPGVLCSPPALVVLTRWHHYTVVSHRVLNTTEDTMAFVQGCLAQHAMENSGECPDQLKALVERGYLPRRPVDYWGQYLYYSCIKRDEGPQITLASAGQDRAFQTDDDITRTFSLPVVPEQKTRLIDIRW